MFPTLLLTALLAQDPSAEELAGCIDDARKAWDVPGIAVVIVHKDAILYINGHGLRELGKPEPITADTLFPLGSCTKGFTVATLAALVGEKQLTWDDPVSKYVPNFTPTDASIRDCLSHRTGMNGHDLLWYRAPWDHAESIRRFSLMSPVQPIRVGMRYSSIPFVAAAKAGEIAGGKAWADDVRTRFFEPLGMTTAGTRTTDALQAKDRASGHSAAGVVPWYPMDSPHPAGSIHASARDIAAWLRFQLGDGTWDGKRLIAADAFAEMHRPQIVQRFDADDHPETHQLCYALGWVTQDYRGKWLVSHAGAIDGFRAHLTLCPKDGIALAIFANREGTRMNLALSNTLVDRLLKLPTKDWNEHYRARIESASFAERMRQRTADRQAAQSPPLALTRYVGEYENPGYGKLRIQTSDGKLRWEWAAFKGTLEPAGGNFFRIPEPLPADAGVGFVFEGDRVGSVSMFGVEFRPIR